MLTRSTQAVLAIVLLMPRSAMAAETLGTEVVVRVYDTSDANPDERRAALDVAASILAAASVDVIWVTCGRITQRLSAANAQRCETPVVAGELTVRLLRSLTGDARRDVLPLGDALVDPHGGTGTLATVYLDRVAWTAGQAGVSRQTLLGRTIAHELAHLLMATSGHGGSGLMRRVWLRAELRRGNARDWLLAPGDVALIRERTRRRATGTQASPP